MMQAEENKKWWANALMIGGVVGLACVILGALGTKIGVWGFEGGFILLAVGVVLATIVFFLGVVAFVYCAVKGMRAERSALLIGTGLSVLILALMGNQYLAARSVPPIHNISTDTQNPPQFDQVVALRDAQGANPLALNTEVIAQQQAAYPQLKPLITQRAPEQVLASAEQVLKDMGMEIVSSNAQLGIVEATDETFWFGFKDDVVVRVRPEAGGSVVDVRSVSRVGQSDLGKNAQRIAEILHGIGS
ncbi:MAG: DUF1499 domain-containing protein [Pseudomonadota bacterium]